MPGTLALCLLFALGQGPQGPPPDTDFQPDPSWKAIDQTKKIWFDRAGKRVIVRARISIQDGPLEHLMCLSRTKEHEAILVTDAVPRQIHAALLLTGAEPGSAVKFRPEYQPPKGDPIRIEVEWRENGKLKKVDARDWIKDEKTGKPLAEDWVFAGSEIVTDPRTKETYYTADDGDIITVANFSSAMLDLPIRSSAEDADRLFVADGKKVPPRNTWVTVYLRPAREQKPRGTEKPQKK